ncbi:microtubule-associated protein 9 isoform X2 [Pleurodeles waltl]|uniref:microtubule-associated protein 9 isoform X2 n=1 Tax=Pleurodeles waltl TaxID=8319 RepID=UPI00370948A8
MSDDENIGTTLAYTKSPKTSKRTSFQDELKKVVSARKARHSTIEESDDSDYSDEFEEIDDDDVFKNNFTTKSTNKTTKRTISSNFLLSDDEDEPRKMSFLKSKNLIDSYEDNEWGDTNNENKPPSSQERRPDGGEQKSPFFSEYQKYNKSIIQDEGDAKPVPIPKPRDYKIKSSQSEEGIAISALDETFKPTPLQRSILRRNNHVEESRIDERSSSSRPSSSHSAPSSMTKLNGKSSENIELLETFISEGQNQSSPQTPTSKPGLSFTEDHPGGSVLTVSSEGTFPFTKEHSELEQQGTSPAKVDERLSPSVLELMMATVYEQSKQQLIENPHLEISNCETQMPHKSRQKVQYDPSNSSGHDAENRNTAEQQRHKVIQEKNFKNKEETSGRVNSPSTRYLDATLQHTKKNSSVTNSTYKTAKSRYLGTLTVLDNKQLLKSPSDPEGADTLRAAVYQDWLEKKKIFLHELQKIKKMEEEKEKEKKRLEGGAKKEEASASFQAWKAVKTKELKKNLMKLKEEEEKKRNELEQMAEKKEESKKVFEKWKEDKEEHLKEKIRKEKQAEMEKKRKEEQAVAEKKKESKLAFCKWSEKKEDVLKSKKKEKLQEEKEKQEKERAEKEWQEKKAMEEYERWLEKKERNDKIVKKQKKLQVILEEEPIPPWSPPGRTVPMGK